MTNQRFNMRPTLRLTYDERPRSFYMGIEGLPNRYYLRPLRLLFIGPTLIILIPYASVQTFRWLDRLPVWENRIREKRMKKVAFDFMLKSMAEKERDVLEEFSDY